MPVVRYRVFRDLDWPMLLVALVTMLLCVSCGSRGKFMDCLFESCSACGSVGLSTGLTPMSLPSTSYVIPSTCPSGWHE